MADVGSKQLFEDDKIILWEINEPVNKGLDEHTHHHIHYFVQANDCTVEVGRPDGSSNEVDLKAWEIHHYPANVTHSAKNIDKQSRRFRTILVELKDKSHACDDCAQGKANNTKNQFLLTQELIALLEEAWAKSVLCKQAKVETETFPEQIADMRIGEILTQLKTRAATLQADQPNTISTQRQFALALQMHRVERTLSAVARALIESEQTRIEALKESERSAAILTAAADPTKQVEPIEFFINLAKRNIFTGNLPAHILAASSVLWLYCDGDADLLLSGMMMLALKYTINEAMKPLKTNYLDNVNHFTTLLFGQSWLSHAITPLYMAPDILLRMPFRLMGGKAPLPAEDRAALRLMLPGSCPG